MAHPQMFDDTDEVLARLRAICGALPGCHEKVSHGRPNFAAGERGKVFAVYGGGVKVRPGEHRRYERGLILKPDPAEQAALEQDDRFLVPAYYGPSGWRMLDLDREDTDWDEVAELVDASYRQVAGARLLAQLDASGRSEP